MACGSWSSSYYSNFNCPVNHLQKNMQNQTLFLNWHCRYCCACVFFSFSVGSEMGPVYRHHELYLQWFYWSMRMNSQWELAFHRVLEQKHRVITREGVDGLSVSQHCIILLFYAVKQAQQRYIVFDFDSLLMQLCVQLNFRSYIFFI